ncbi:MAG: hypothetical protein PHQ86_04185 [Dehalococcoidales bacterium]|nr:hypothetical protein [Dehalococcoidales bacterium]
MIVENKHRVAKWMRWTARLIGLLTAGLILIMFIGETVTELLDEGLEPVNADIMAGILIGVLGVIGLTGCIVSWWRERLASLLLVLTAAGFGIHIGIYAGRNQFLAWSIIGLPYLVAAALLFYSGKLSNKTVSEKR